MGIGTQTNKLIIQIGNGATPTEVFSATCGANQFTVTLTNNTGEAVVLDCVDPLTTPAVITRWLESQDTAAEIAGVISVSALGTWQAWADSGASKNVKLLIQESLANNGGHWIVPCILTSFELSKTGSGIVQFTASLISTGPRVWTAAAA